MKKTLIASAVAAATLSANTFAMDPATELAERLDSMPTFYGNIQLAQVYNDDGDEEKSTFADNGSTFGVKHSHEISPGVEGFFKAEFHFDSDEQNKNKGLGEKFDEAYIGVKGDFGQVWIGSDDTAYEAVDVIDMYEAVGIAGDLADVTENNTIQYKTPKIAGGLTAQVTYVMDDGQDTVDEYEFDEVDNILNLVGTRGIDIDQEHVGALNVQYEMDAITLIGAYAMAEDSDNEDTFGLAVQAGLGDITVAAQYENYDELDLFALNVVASMGKNQFALGASYTDGDNEELTAISGQALHNLSDNMYMYVEALYAKLDEADDDAYTVALGATYAF